MPSLIWNPREPPTALAPWPGGFATSAARRGCRAKTKRKCFNSAISELNDHVIGTYSVAVVVNAADPVANLTKEQVRDLFTGVVTNWSAVGGPDAPVHLFARDPISGTYIGFKELAMDNKPYAREQNLFTNYQGIVTGVAKDTDSIGYSSLELATGPGVKAVAVGGIAPGAESVDNEKYPYARKLHLFTIKGREAPDALGLHSICVVRARTESSCGNRQHTAGQG